MGTYVHASERDCGRRAVATVLVDVRRFGESTRVRLATRSPVSVKLTSTSPRVASARTTTLALVARRRRRVRRGIRVRRVVRRVELGSLFRLAIGFHLLCYAVSMAVLAILLNVVDRLGLLGRIEKFLQESGFGNGFKVDLAVVLRGAAGIGLGLVIVFVVATMLLGFFFNGLAGFLGGLVITVLEERPQAPRPRTVSAPEVTPTSANDVAPFDESVSGWEDATMWDTPSPTGAPQGSAV